MRLKLTTSALLTLLYGSAQAASPGLTSLDNGLTLGKPSNVILIVVDQEGSSATNANYNATYITALSKKYADFVNGKAGTLDVDLSQDPLFTSFLGHALKVNVTAAYARDDAKLTNFDASGAGYPAGSNLSFSDTVQWGLLTSGTNAGDFTSYKLTEVYNTAGGTTQQGFVAGWIAAVDGALAGASSAVKTVSAGSPSWFDANFGLGGPANPTSRTLVSGASPSGRLLWVSNTDGNGVARSSSELVATLALSSAGALHVVGDTPPTGGVSVSGTPTQNQTLQASNNLVDPDGPASLTVSYQWNAGGKAIANATTASLTLAEAQVGKSITVTASYTDGLGRTERVTSAAVGPVANVNDPPTGSVTFTGNLAQGQTLTASNTLHDADGPATLSVTYQWKANGTAIGTGNTYTLTQADVGKSISVTATYTDGHGTVESVDSTSQGPVQNVNFPYTGEVHITPKGTVSVGQTLTASNTLIDPDGITGSVAYQWQANDIDIEGATGSTYVIRGVDAGKTLKVVASYTDGDGLAVSVPGSDTATVVLGLVPDVSALFFGNVAPGKPSPVLTVTLTNKGSAAAPIGDIADPSAPFVNTADSCSKKSLLPGKSCKLGFKFSPGASDSGAKSATVDLGQAGVLSLSGNANATAADIVIDDTVIDAGAGERVTVPGTGFSSVKGTVKVGTKPAKVLSWDDRAISFTLPVLPAGAQSVTVTSKDKKKTDTAINGIVVHKPGNLVIGTVTPFGKNTLIPVSGQYFGVAKPKVVLRSKTNTKKSKPAVVVVVNAGTAVTAAVPTAWLGTDTYTVEVSSSAGSTSIDLPHP